MMNNAIISDDVLSDYLDESQERLDRIVSDLLNIDSGVMNDLIGLKRELHTLKGLSAMVGFDDVSKLCHEMEDWLEAASAQGLEGAVQPLLDCCDFMSSHADAVASGTTIPKTPESILAKLRENTSGAPHERQQSVAAPRQAADTCYDISIDDSADDLDQPPSRRMKYLIVDDNEADRESLLEILVERGNCDVAEDGEQAIEEFRRALEGGQPYDGVFLEILMPGINGHVTLETIRCIEHQHSLYGSSGVKVIMTTAVQDERHVVRAFKTGCQSYIAKPIKESELFVAMQRMGMIESAPEKPRIRFLDDVTKVIVKTASDSTQAAEVVNESYIDINLLLENVCHLRPSQDVEVMYKGAPMRAVVETIDPQNEDCRYPVCLVWN